MHNREDNCWVVTRVNRLNAPLLRRADLLLAEVSGFGIARSENATGERSHAKRRAMAAGVLEGGFLMEVTPPITGP